MPKRDFTAYEFIERKGAYLHIRCVAGRYPGPKPEMLEFAIQHAPDGYTVTRFGTQSGFRGVSFSYYLDPQPGFPDLSRKIPAQTSISTALATGLPEYMVE
jgi:hypothetical protein